MATPSSQKVIESLTALANGLAKHANGAVFNLAGQTFTGPQMLAEVQAILADAAAVPAAHAALTEAIRADVARRAESAWLLDGVRALLQTMYKRQLTTLADFGLAPPRERRPPTNEEELLMIERRKATRAKRRTMGKKQKAAIKGDVTGVVITPKTK